MKTRTKSMAIFFTVLIAIVLGTGCVQMQAQTGQGQPEKITVSVYAGNVAAVVRIATDQKLLRANGLAVTLEKYVAGALGASTLLAGNVNIATAAEHVLITNSLDEADLKLLGIVATSNVIGLIPRKGVNSYWLSIARVVTKQIRSLEVWT